jgi:hypothetical protein
MLPDLQILPDAGRRMQAVSANANRQQNQERRRYFRGHGVARRIPADEPGRLVRGIPGPEIRRVSTRIFTISGTNVERFRDDVSREHRLDPPQSVLIVSEDPGGERALGISAMTADTAFWLADVLRSYARGLP